MSTAMNLKLYVAQVSSNNGSMVISSQRVYGGVYGDFYLARIADLSGGSVNLSRSIALSTPDDHLFELIFLIGSVVLLLGLFFFVAGMFCCRQSFKKKEIESYEAGTTATDNQQEQQGQSNRGYVPNLQQNGSFRGDLSRRGSFQSNGSADQRGGMNRVGSMNNGSSVNMNRTGSQINQRRPTFCQEY